LQLQEVITKILKENDILPKKEDIKVEESHDESAALIEKFTNFQNTIVTQNSK
jgi:hypothetical protein